MASKAGTTWIAGEKATTMTALLRRRWVLMTTTTALMRLEVGRRGAGKEGGIIRRVSREDVGTYHHGVWGRWMLVQDGVYKPHALS